MRRVISSFLLNAFLGAQAPVLTLGQPMPDFSLSGVDGRRVTRQELKGPVCVVFLSTQCPYVLATEDRINALAKTYGGKVSFVGINANESESAARREEGLAGMKAHAAKKGYAFPYLKDESQAVVKAFGALATPDFFLFNAQGVLVFRGRMDDSPMKPEKVQRQHLRDALDALLAGRPIDPEQPRAQGCSIKWKG